MILYSTGMIQFEEGEPVMRSCWECNPAHEHLKKVNMLHWCFECERYWVFDRFCDTFAGDETMDKYFKGLGLNPGESTSKVDKGYRVTVIQSGTPIETKD